MKCPILQEKNKVKLCRKTDLCRAVWGKGAVGDLLGITSTLGRKAVSL